MDLYSSHSGSRGAGLETGVDWTRTHRTGVRGFGGHWPRMPPGPCPREEHMTCSIIPSLNWRGQVMSTAAVVELVILKEIPKKSCSS